ncbi:uncharacterized protein PGTG_21027 [Puccinia graminis f. sp. tritici CRL 75-36-700-3]|uniref:Uncharacterized protein n=1 Tax=Puccinia graminis f. sp. tritici (strain CRL 75-36-700-3 / race SCCL) TaxID=418459 RepID=H6QQ65_PUCGT|nr:uncharacterized protein PGTG_21027 [Puccinia graminis f. sp. tritici CRL 75-36-700-3]EHS64677.1 hypothetical protein PGTG_21027 [Puccinia graminis f. sp. tritici CRL 75-36-700-3]
MVPHRTDSTQPSLPAPFGPPPTSAAESFVTSQRYSHLVHRTYMRPPAVDRLLSIDA